MENGKRVYQIVINGIKESIDAVKTLNQQLDALEARIKSLEGKVVKVGTSSSGGGGGGNASALSAEEKLEKEILATEEKISKVRSESYQKLLAAKEELKEATTYAKAQYAATENGQGLFDTNTMQGMKAQLKSIKQEMQTVDVNDDKFKQLTQQANELNTKLKEIEQSYGQYGRSVGNYANGVAEGMQKVVIKVGETERTFESAKQASRELGNELKNMAVNGQRGTKEYNELDEAVRKLNSDLKDVSVSSAGMDKLMDSLQGVTALASTASGLKNLFGFDGGNVEQGIQKLVALQNVMKGIEEIRQQMKTEEGIGALITKGNDMVDKMVDNLTAMATNFLGVGKAANVAATGVNVFGKALKAVIGMGIGFVIAEALEYVTDLIDGIKEWAHGDADLIKAEDLVGIEVDKVNRKLEERLKLNEQLNTGKEGDDNRQRLADEQAYAEAIKESMELMDKELKLQDQIQAKPISQTFGKDFGVTTFGGFTRAIENVDDFIERYEALDAAAKKGEGLKMMKDGFEICSLSASDVRDELAHMQKEITGDYVTAMKHFDVSTKEGVDQLRAFIAEQDKLTKGIYSSALANMGNIIENSGLREALLNAKNLIGGFFDYVSANSAKFERTLQSALNRAKEDINNAGKTAEQLQIEEVKKYYAGIRQQANEQGRWLTADELDLLDKGEQAKIKAIKERGASTSKAIRGNGVSARNAVRNNGRSMVDTIKQVESNITDMKLKLMQDGLHKELMQLDENNRKEIEKIRQSGKKVEEQLGLQAQVYAKEKNRLIEEYNKQTFELSAKVETDTAINKIDELQNKMEEFNRVYFSLNYPTGRNDKIDISPESLLGDDVDNAIKDLDKYSDELKKIFDLYDLKNDYIAVNRLKDWYEVLKEQYLPELNDTIKEMYQGFIDEGRMNEANEYLASIFEEKTHTIKAFLTKYTQNVELVDGKFQQSLTQSFESQINTINNLYRMQLEKMAEYMRERERLVEGSLTKQQELELASVNRTISEVQRMFKEARKQYKLLPEMSDDDAISHYFELHEKGMEQDNNLLSDNEKELMAYAVRINTLYEQLGVVEDKYTNQTKKNQQDSKEEMQKNNAKYYDEALAAIERYITKANELLQAQPEIGKWSLIDLSKTKKNYNELIDLYKSMLDEIKGLETDALYESIDNTILGEDLQRINDNIAAVKQTVNSNLEDVKQKNKELGLDFVKQINDWVQQLGNALDSILGSFAEIQSNRYEREIEAQEKYIKEYEDLLDYQEGITQEHADKVNSIEDELATARGDRRQHLIDQLNAEIAARRASAAEEKKIEKQKQAADDKKKKLEQQQAKNQKDMALWQARVNAAMAISNAAVNKYPIPAIPMIALATAIGAAQIAAVKSQNIPQYAEGGVLVGKSHKQGGIPVLGGKAEVEGGEYITNKITTTKNVELLEYINSKKKKVDITDLLEFYGSPSVKKNITAVRTKFASGGILPTTTTELGINDRLMQSFEDYSNRPVVVEVKEILSKADSVRNVQVLAGLTPEAI